MTNEEIYKAGYDAGYERPTYDGEAWQDFLSKHPELAVEPEIEAGEGHRWLDAGETIIDGDEFWQPMDGTWEEQRNSTGSPVRHDCVFRRKIEPSRTHTAEEIWKAGYNQASSDVPEFYADRSWKRNGEPRYGNSPNARKDPEPGKRCVPCRETGALHCSDPLNCGGPWDNRKIESKPEPKGLAELISLQERAKACCEIHGSEMYPVWIWEIIRALAEIDLATLEPVPAIPEIREGYEECDWKANHVPEDWMYLDEALDTPAWMFFPKTWGRHYWERLRESHFYWFKAAGGRMARPKPAPVSEASEAPFVPEFGQKVQITHRGHSIDGQFVTIDSRSRIWALIDGEDGPKDFSSECTITPLEPTDHSLDDSRDSDDSGEEVEPVPAIPDLPEEFEYLGSEWSVDDARDDWVHLVIPKGPYWESCEPVDGHRINFQLLKRQGFVCARPKPAPVSEASEAPFVPEFGQKVWMVADEGDSVCECRYVGQQGMNYWAVLDGNDFPESWRKEVWSIEPLPTEREGGEA